MIVGFSDLGRHVSMFAQMLDYKVSVCEPRKEFRHMDSISSLSISDSYPDDFIRRADVMNKLLFWHLRMIRK